MTVHNHGTEDGPGLSCREYLLDGVLRGRCLDICPPLDQQTKPHCPDCNGIVGETGIL